MIADISSYQGDIDWVKARKKLDFIIFRSSVGSKADARYESYAHECGVPYAAYHYVKSGSEAEARAEAEFFVRCANKGTPVFYVADIEYTTQTKVTTEAVCVAFLQRLRELGCKRVGLYIGQSRYPWAGRAIGMADIVWIPRYGKNTGVPAEQYRPIYPHHLWQYTSVGAVDGIKGAVDLNLMAGVTLDWLINGAPVDDNKEVQEMSVIIGSARSSYGSEKRGDQNGGKEVSTQSGYIHSKGWRVFRAIDYTVAKKLAYAMRAACDNNNIGYSQADRLALKNALEKMSPVTYDPATIKEPTNCDCSALVRSCCMYAGIKLSNFTTANEASALLGSGAFQELTDDRYTKRTDYWKSGDILVTKTKGHTAIVLTDGSKAASDHSGKATVTYHLGERQLKNGCTGPDVRELQTLLINAGFDCGKFGIDGEFGDATELALTRFQQQYGLQANGVADAATVEKLQGINGTEDADTGRFVRIKGGDCYIRVEPSTSSSKLGIAHEGEVFEYAGSTSEAGWHKIMHRVLGAGWVSGKYSALEG